MKLYIRDNHPINIIDGNKIDKRIEFWLNKWSLSNSEYVCLAFDKGKVIGFMRFDQSKTGKYLYACGTWVSNAFRGKGIAKKMWRKVIKFAGPKTIEVCVTTPGGLRLVKSIRDEFASIRVKCYNRSSSGSSFGY